MHPYLTSTPEGLALAGVLLAGRKSDGSLAINEDRISALIYAAYGGPLSPRALSYIKRAGEMMAEVKDSDWYNCTPHHGNNVPVLAKVNMRLALTGLNSVVNVRTSVQNLTKAIALLDGGTSLEALMKRLEKDFSDNSDGEDEEDGEDDSEGDEGDDEADSDSNSSSDDSDFDSKHPRWPAGSPDSQGGEFRPKDDGDAVSSDPGSISADGVRSALTDGMNNPSRLPQGTQMADFGEIMTDANVDSGNTESEVGGNNKIVPNNLSLYQWSAVSIADSNHDNTTTVTAGSQIMLETGSDASPTLGQFWVTATAIPLDTNGNVQPSLTPSGSNWFSPVWHSSGFTGSRNITNTFVLQANPASPSTSQWRWTVTIPPQEDAYGNISEKWVNVYVPKSQ